MNTIYIIRDWFEHGVAVAHAVKLPKDPHAGHVHDPDLYRVTGEQPPQLNEPFANKRDYRGEILECPGECTLSPDRALSAVNELAKASIAAIRAGVLKTRAELRPMDAEWSRSEIGRIQAIMDELSTTMGLRIKADEHKDRYAMTAYTDTGHVMGRFTIWSPTKVDMFITYTCDGTGVFTDGSILASDVERVAETHLEGLRK